MAKPSKERQKFLVEATTRYHEKLTGSPAEEYLASRGLMAPSVASQVGKFRLGFVGDPLPGHEPFQGMLAIPYLRRSSVGEWTAIGMKFRCIEDHEHYGHAKYMAEEGSEPRLYHTLPLIEEDDTIAICEGELDTIIANACGVPAVGVGGTNAHAPHFWPAFGGYGVVYILADNDHLKPRKNCSACSPEECRGHNAGLEFASDVRKKLPNSRIIPMAPGHDVNSMVLEYGKQALLEKLV